MNPLHIRAGIRILALISLFLMPVVAHDAAQVEPFTFGGWVAFTMACAVLGMFTQA